MRKNLTLTSNIHIPEPFIFFIFFNSLYLYFMKKSIHTLLLISTLGASSVSIYAQQQLFIMGDDGTAAPELYIQDGTDAYIYVQGGVTVSDQLTAGGTSAAAPSVFVNGGLFIDGGDILNATANKNIRFDRSTSGAYTVAAAIPTIKKNDAATVHLMGSGTQNIDYAGGATSGEVSFHNLSVDRTGVAGLARNVNVVRVTVGDNSAFLGSSNGKLSLEDEIVNLGGNRLDVLNSSTTAIDRAVTDASATLLGGLDVDNQEPIGEGMVTTTAGSDGRLGRLTVAGGSANKYLYPVGTGTDYRPATITPGAASGMFYVQVNPSTPNINVYGSPAPAAVNPNFYWKIHQDGATAGSDYRLYDSFTNIAPNASCPTDSLLLNLGITQADGLNTAWVDEASMSTIPTSSTALLWAESSSQVGAAAQNRVPSFINTAGDAMTLSNMDSVTGVPCMPFPINLLDITALPINNTYIRIDWTTLQETNSHHFELERSLISSANFQYITTLNTLAPNGNSNSPLAYSHNDQNVQKGVRYYYRVKMVDIDGGYKYSNVVNAKLSDLGTFITGIYPNPTDGKINVNINTSDVTEYVFRIYNVLGQEISKTFVEAKTGDNVFELDLSRLAIGTYELVIIENGKNQGAFKIVRF